MKSEKMIKELGKMFTLANEKFYNNELPNPLLLIVPAKRRPVLGYCTTAPVWGEADPDLYEIAISAEYLYRGLEEIMGTMLHEMVHYYNGLKGVSDCTQTQYHKKSFKEVADGRGLVTTKSRNRGYSQTELTSETQAWVKSLGIDEEVFKTTRAIPSKKASNYKKPHKYECPSCGAKFQSRKPINAMCEDCGEMFEEQY